MGRGSFYRCPMPCRLLQLLWFGSNASAPWSASASGTREVRRTHATAPFQFVMNDVPTRNPLTSARTAFGECRQVLDFSWGRSMMLRISRLVYHPSPRFSGIAETSPVNLGLHVVACAVFFGDFARSSNSVL